MAFEPFRDLTRREEECRLRADGHDQRPGKRKREDLDQLPIRERGDVIDQKDPVTLGYCTEADGRALFDSWVDKYRADRDSSAMLTSSLRSLTHERIPGKGGLRVVYLM